MVNRRMDIIKNVEELERTLTSASKVDRDSIVNVQDQVGNTVKVHKAAQLRERCHSDLGPKFDAVYAYLTKVRAAAKPPAEADVNKELLKLVGGDKGHMQGCFLVDQLVFHESMVGLAKPLLGAGGAKAAVGGAAKPGAKPGAKPAAAAKPGPKPYLTAKPGVKLAPSAKKPGALVEVCRHGGHVVSWRNRRGEDLIFTSSKAIFQAPKAIRGGVPVCFPQFGMMGPMPTQHGFARNVSWELAGVDEGGSRATLVLRYDGTSQPAYPHPFELRTVVSVGDEGEGALRQQLHVINTGTSPMRFTAALHTYYQVASIAGVSVAGLSGTRFLDNLQGQAEATDESPEVAFSSELDRVYVGAPHVITITDAAARHVFEITKCGFPDAVVWNPWVEKAAAMADFGDEEYKVMLCIEPAVAGSGAVELAPGGSWSGSQAVVLRDA
ncbi:hypothetical protein FOA52_004341 [Chlamydomonas sp. UWO 241]|nr:hypothetical protein FOA52_004341 [Chlamydomonas sp. UWO 241]